MIWICYSNCNVHPWMRLVGHGSGQPTRFFPRHAEWKFSKVFTSTLRKYSCPFAIDRLQLLFATDQSTIIQLRTGINVTVNPIRLQKITERNYSRFRQFSERCCGNSIICMQKSSLYSYRYPFHQYITMFKNGKKMLEDHFEIKQRNTNFVTGFLIEDVIFLNCHGWI